MLPLHPVLQFAPWAKTGLRQGEADLPGLWLSLLGGAQFLGGGFDVVLVAVGLVELAVAVVVVVVVVVAVGLRTPYSAS